MKKLLRWTNEERDRLLELLKLMVPKHPGESLKKLLLRAQEQLPPDRRRRKEAMPSVPTFIRAHFGGTKAPSSAPQAMPSFVGDAVAAESGPTVHELLDQMTMDELTRYYELRGGETSHSIQPYTFEEVAYTTPLADLARVYHQRLQEQQDSLALIARESQLAMRKLTEFVRGVTGSGQPLRDHTRDALPLIVVVGLVKDENAKVLARFDNMARFVFFEKDRAPSDLLNLNAADCLVFMAKYLTSKWKAEFGGNPKARFVEGSLLGLYDHLSVIINQLAKK